MSWQPKTQENLIKKLIREQDKLRDVVYRTQFGSFAGAGIGGQGGFGFGSTGSANINHYHPISHEMSNIKFDDTVDSTDGYSHIRVDATIIICEEAGSGNTPSATDPQVKWLDQTIFDGTLLLLTPKEGKTLTLLAGGNINISSNVTVSDDEIIYLQFLEEHPSSGSGTHGSYNLLKTSTVGSHTHAGADITSGTVHVDRLGSGASNTKFLRGDNTWQTVSGGSTTFVGFTADDDLSMSTYNIDGVDQLKFSTAESAQQDLSTSDWGIESYDDGSGYGDANHLGMLYQVPSGKNHRFKVGSGIDLEISGDGLKFPETHGTPSANGTIYFDGTHIKCRTNSGLKSLTDIGSGSGGVTNPVNAHLSLGGNQLQRVTGTLYDSTSTDDSSIIGTSLGLVYAVTSSGDYHYFTTQGTTKLRIKSDKLVILGSNSTYTLDIVPTSTGVDFFTPDVTNADYGLRFGTDSAVHRFFADGDYWLYGTINWINPSSTAPSNTSSVSRWIPVQVGSVVYRLPLYQ